jgi:enoyl-CoA hydratase/carnithine racemase
MAANSTDLLFEKDGDVAIITMNRPDRLNAISGPMLDELTDRLVAADADEAVRAVVLTGAGRGFCSGLDLKDTDGGAPFVGGGLTGRPGELDLRRAPPTVLHNLDTPTICALNGAAAGYGMDLALGCDLRIASSSAKLSWSFVRLGVVPESGGTWLLPRLVGYAKAAELIFSGATVAAAECLALGLVNRVVVGDQLMAETLALAHTIAANAPLAVRASKRLMRQANHESFPTHVQRANLQLQPLIGSQDFAEGLAAFTDRRRPRFEGH